eukprot:Partr_v1_DN28260_c2_g1_i2_m75394 putative rRNA methyltransferase
MGQRKKTGKERLDKYYHLAKTQGYRARSAFKLIQLNKKFQFLDKAKVLIDLCAAPGGWLQVASKYMPMNSLIVGVDLAPIKPIPKVITHVEDITTDSCRSALKRDLKEWKADVVLHDGAPNVGSAWVQDAYVQSELVLHSLRLACDFLAPKGTFVTKVFRSKNYNHLLFVFNQLFDKVEATKPPSSRNVSAEIFVVCTGFKAPKKIDPKFLDPRHVFQDVDGEEADGVTPGNALNMILFPDKEAKKRHRQGYADGDYTLHHSASVYDFVVAEKESDAVELLAGHNQLKWGVKDIKPVVADEEGNMLAEVDYEAVMKKIEKHHLTTDEIRACCDDLKVLGRKEYKALLKWRQHVHDFLFPKPVKTAAEVDAESVIMINEDDVDSLDELENMTDKIAALEKKVKKKRLQKLTRERRKVQLNMATPADIGIEEGGGTIDDIHNEDATLDGKPLFNSAQLLKSSVVPDDIQDAEMDEEEELVDSSDEDLDSFGGSDLDSDDDIREKELEDSYELFMQKQTEKDPKLRVKMMRAQEEEFTATSDKEKADSESESEDENVKPVADEAAVDELPVEPTAETKMWFSQPVFNNIDLAEDDDDTAHASEEKTPKPVASKKKKPKTKKKVQEASSDVEMADKENDDDPEFTTDPAQVLSTAQAITLAMEMVRDGGRHKEDMLTNLGYRKNVYHDTDDLPAWFVDDERRHNKPLIPVTKEAVALLKERQKALDTRPIKKVVEAKDRKKRKATKKLEKLREKMNAMVEEDGDDPEIGSKLKEVNKIMKRALGKAKAADKKRVQLVVANGGQGGQGRPNGVKGRYKMVDARMKKEVRAFKAKEKTKGRSKSRK